MTLNDCAYAKFIENAGLFGQIKTHKKFFLSLIFNAQLL